MCVCIHLFIYLFTVYTYLATRPYAAIPHLPICAPHSSTYAAWPRHDPKPVSSLKILYVYMCKSISKFRLQACNNVLHPGANHTSLDSLKKPCPRLLARSLLLRISSKPRSQHPFLTRAAESLPTRSSLSVITIWLPPNPFTNPPAEIQHMLPSGAPSFPTRPTLCVIIIGFSHAPRLPTNSFPLTLPRGIF